MFKFTTVSYLTKYQHDQTKSSSTLNFLNSPIKWFKAEKTQLKVTKLKSQYFHQCRLFLFSIINHWHYFHQI